MLEVSVKYSTLLSIYRSSKCYSLYMFVFVVKHFNFCWQDMTVPTLHMMMDIVHIAVNELSTGGKVRNF